MLGINKSFDWKSKSKLQHSGCDCCRVANFLFLRWLSQATAVLFIVLNGTNYLVWSSAWFSRKWRPQRLEQWSWCWNFYLQQSCYKHKHPAVSSPHHHHHPRRHRKLNKSSWQGRFRSAVQSIKSLVSFPLDHEKLIAAVVKEGGRWWTRTLADPECDVTCILLSWWLVYFISILWNSCILVPHCI